MQDYLVFRLYGAMASWGQAAVGGDRPTGRKPTRSAIVGLLAAALGIRRDDPDSLSSLEQQIRLSIKQLAAGNLMRDYHTTQVPPHRKGERWSTRKRELQEDNLNTVLSTRDYRCDGLWIVSVQLAGTGEYSLEDLKAALLKPEFTLYLGRKSCPVSSPVYPQIVAANDVKQALDTGFPALSNNDSDERWFDLNQAITYYWEGELADFPAPPGAAYTTHPWDKPLDKTRWQFAQNELHQVTIQGEY